MTIERLKEHHLEDLLEIESSSFSVPWSKQAFEDELKNPLAHYLVAVDEMGVQGYLGMWKIVDEIHITNIAVASTARRKGIASRLLNEAIDCATKDGCVAMTLEVRPSNEAAVGLYRNYQFLESAVRPGYYTNPKEDALIMWKQLIKDIL